MRDQLTIGGSYSERVCAGGDILHEDFVLNYFLFLKWEINHKMAQKNFNWWHWWRSWEIGMSHKMFTNIFTHIVGTSIPFYRFSNPQLNIILPLTSLLLVMINLYFCLLQFHQIIFSLYWTSSYSNHRGLFATPNWNHIVLIYCTCCDCLRFVS